MSAKQPPLGPTVIGSKAPALVAFTYLCDPGAIHQLTSEVDNGCHLRCSFCIQCQEFTTFFYHSHDSIPGTNPKFQGRAAWDSSPSFFWMFTNSENAVYLTFV